MEIMRVMKTDQASAVDPVCGMTVNPETAAGSFDYNGKTYYFCAKHCLHKFSQNPELFLSKSSTPTQIQPIGITRQKDTREFTCPMHPEVRQGGHGSCPQS